MCAGAERRAASVIIIAAEPLIIVDAKDFATIGFMIAALRANRGRVTTAGTRATNDIAVAAKMIAAIMTLNLMMKIFKRSVRPIPNWSSRTKHNTCKPTNEHLVYVLAASCHFGISF